MKTVCFLVFTHVRIGYVQIFMPGALHSTLMPISSCLQFTFNPFSLTAFHSVPCRLPSLWLCPVIPSTLKSLHINCPSEVLPAFRNQLKSHILQKSFPNPSYLVFPPYRFCTKLLHWALSIKEGMRKYYF